MEWSNEKSLQFLELFKTEPCLWNPSLQSSKNRAAVGEAWQRIAQSLPFPATPDDLKRKKESLLGYYRCHFNKYKKSLKSAANEVYTTNWFAFELMDSFLRPVYESKAFMDPESADDNSTDKTINESAEEVHPNESHPGQSIPTDSTNEYKSTRNGRNIETSKRPRLQNISRNRELDEYDHFAFMIAAKIRKFQNPDDREMLMNAIQNITFEFYMKNKERATQTQSATQYRRYQSAHSSPMDQYSDGDDYPSIEPEQIMIVKRE